MVTFWATFGKFGLLFNVAFGHSDQHQGTESAKGANGPENELIEFSNFSNSNLPIGSLNHLNDDDDDVKTTIRTSSVRNMM